VEKEHVAPALKVTERASVPKNTVFGASAPIEEKSLSALSDESLAEKLDAYSLESIVELKISRFLDQVGKYYPQNLYSLIMKKTEKPLLSQILRRTGGNQVHAARILGINRNTLRKKMKIYEI
jgi:DNA-binding protein Fis